MMSVIIAAVFSILGVIVGGALRALESWRARKLESDALLSALVAEVEALTRLIGHRQFVEGLTATQQSAQLQIMNGNGNLECDFIVIDLKRNYFVTYEASVDKIGFIHPYWADRITRFYTFIKAVSENYDPASPFQDGISADTVNDVITNDLALLQTVVMLGNHISSDARVLVPPSGVINPFPSITGNEPPLAESHPELANKEAAGT